MMISSPANVSEGKAVHSVKGSLSRWVREDLGLLRYFAWQEGYYAFSIEASEANEVVT